MLIADYWIVRRTQLQLEDLYLSDGVYRYTAGWHLPGVIATVAGCAAAWGGGREEPMRLVFVDTEGKEQVALTTDPQFAGFGAPLLQLVP